MTFEEWHKKQDFWPNEDEKEIMRVAWQAAQEDMRERAALSCEDGLGHGMFAKLLAAEIRALPIEV